MSTIVTRAGKGSALSWVEADANFTNLNTDKLEVATAASTYATQASIANMVETADIGVSVQAYSANLSEYAAVNPTTAGLALLDDVDATAQRTTLGAQATLVSGTNIKTINGNSVLGSGDLAVAIADGDKGDITVSSSGTVWTVDSGAITPTKLSQPLTLGTVATASGVAVDFTSIPSWVRRITIILASVSTSGTSALRVQLGNGGVPKITGYVGIASEITVAPAGAANALGGGGFDLRQTASASVNSGHFVLTLADPATNAWVAAGDIAISSFSFAHTAGAVTLAGVLNMVRLTTINGTDTFDAGQVNVLYEG